MPRHATSPTPDGHHQSVPVCPAITLQLSLPPTANHRLMPSGSGRRLILAPEYRQWQQAAHWQLRSQILPDIMDFMPLQQALQLDIRVYFPDRRRHDLDNVLKGLQDLLVEEKIIADDSLIQQVTLSRAGISRPGHAVLTLQVMAQAA